MSMDSAHNDKTWPHNRIAANGVVRLVLKALGITFLAFLLSKCLIAPFSASTSAIFSSTEKSDFVLTDLFAQVADNRPVRQYDDRIVVVDIKDAGRESIAETLETLSLCGPGAVGLDVNFADAREDDSRLLAALSMNPGILLPLGADVAAASAETQTTEPGSSDAYETRFTIGEAPFFYGQLPGVVYGIVNYPTKNAKATIREVPVTFPMENGGRLPSFVEAMARKVAPQAAAEALKTGNSREYISFHSREFMVIPYEEVADRAEELTGKVVLVGSCTDASDLHPTPVGEMPGIMIHAHALSTMIDGNWLKPMPEWLDGVVAAVICFLIVLAAIGIKSGVRGMLIRFMQLILAYLAVRIGYGLYVDHNIVCNLSSTLLMIAFGLFAVDIWNGGAALCGMIGKRIKRFRNRYNSNLTCEEQF